MRECTHLGWIFFQVVDDSLVVGFGISSLEGALSVFVVEVGVEHAFHLNAHHVAPARFLRAEVEVVWVGSALHLAVGEPQPVLGKQGRRKEPAYLGKSPRMVRHGDDRMP